jgi:hypothetical protein
MKRGKRAKLLYQIIIHLILIGMIFALFFFASVGRVNSRAVKQQILEKQIALLIDSALSQTSILILKNPDKKTSITNLEIKQGKVFVYVNDQKFSKGYAFFTQHSVIMKTEQDKYIIEIK